MEGCVYRLTVPLILDVNCVRLMPSYPNFKLPVIKRGLMNQHF